MVIGAQRWIAEAACMVSSGARIGRVRVLYCVHKYKNFREASALAAEEAAD